MTGKQYSLHWLGFSCMTLAVLAASPPAGAQSSSQLPPVVVEQAKPRATPVRPQRSQAARTAASRRAAARNPAAPAAAPVPSATAFESGTGPVQGYLAGQSTTGLKTDTPLREIAQSVSVVTADRMTDQGVTNVQEAIRYVPGVFADAYGTDSRGDYPRIRGQDPNIFLDGTRVVDTWRTSEWRQEPYMLERVEVFRGPSVLYGDTSVAGLINLISKRPRADGFNEVGVLFDNFGRKQIQLDTTGKLTRDGEWLYRFVGVFRDGHMQTDFVPDDRILLAPSLTWRPTQNTSWTVQGFYQKDKSSSATAFLPHEGMLYPGPNGLIAITRFAGYPGFDEYRTETVAVGSIFEHHFNDAVKFTQNLRYAHNNGVYRSGYANSFSADPFLDPERRTVSRILYNTEMKRDTLTMDNNLQFKFYTGPIHHKVLAGVDFREIHERSRTGGAEDPTPFDLYAPVYTTTVAPELFDNPRLRQNQLGLYAQDQIRLGPWLATLGIRQDFVGSYAVGSPDEDTRATTGRASLMYETPFGFNPYVTYATSFNPVFGANVCFGPCKAQRGEIYEVGFKYNPFPSTSINGAIFDTVERNRLASGNDPLNPFLSVQTGQVRIRGAELEVITKVTPDLNLIAAYSYIDARVEAGDNVGNRVETVPDHQASLWGTYRLSALGLREVTLGSGVRYVGASWDGADILRTPDYTLFDAMIRYETGPWRLQVNATNLADKRHMATCLARGDCFPGMGRTVLGSATYRF